MVIFSINIKKKNKESVFFCQIEENWNYLSNSVFSNIFMIHIDCSSVVFHILNFFFQASVSFK